MLFDLHGISIFRFHVCYCEGEHEKLITIKVE
jgi:hypothetical protein